MQAPAPTAADPAGVARLSPYAQARRTVFWALSLALAGASFGVGFGGSAGMVSGLELWLVSSCVLYSAGILAYLAIVPFDRSRWVAPVTCGYYLAYLCCGLLISFNEEVGFRNYFVYLMWCFPLLAFSKFVTFGTVRAALSIIGTLAPLLIAGMYLPRIFERTGQEGLALTIVFGLAYLTFSLMLNLFSQYREAYLRERERAQALTRTEDMVRRSEARFRRLFSNAATGIGWMSMDLRLLFANRAFCRMLEIDEGRFEAVHYDRLLHADDQAAWQEMLAAMRDGAIAELTLEQRMTAASGKEIWTRTSYAHVDEPDRPGEDSIIFVCQDITEARQSDARSQQARRLEALGKLTGGIAHDFNNLLTVMIGNSEMLERRLFDDARYRPLAEMTREAAERGAELTRRLLAFARRQALAPQVVDSNGLIRELEELLRRSLRENIDLRFFLADGLAPALVDPAQLESVLLNLSINARDAMPDGGKLTIETANVVLDTETAELYRVAPGAYVLIAVADTGHGMTAETARQAFDPFFTTKPPGEGTGLGLSMVYGFARQSRGHVSLYSEPGIGTIAKLYLPQAVGATEAAMCRPKADILVGGSERILLVEDNALVRHYSLNATRSLGYEVMAVEDAEAALHILDSPAEIDLLLTDVVLPGGMNGARLAERARDLRPGLKVLFMSGYTANAIDPDGRLDPGVELLQKPFGLNGLATKIRRVIDAP